MASPSFWTSFRSFWFKDELHFRPLRDVGRLGTISFTLLLMLDLCNSNHKLAVTLLMYGTGPRRPKTWHRGGVRACEQRAVDGNHRAVLRIVRRLLCPERL